VPVFCHAAKRSQNRKRHLMPVGDRKKRQDPLLIGLDWKGLPSSFASKVPAPRTSPCPVKVIRPRIGVVAQYGMAGTLCLSARVIIVRTMRKVLPERVPSARHV